MNFGLIFFFGQISSLTRDHYESPFQDTKDAPPIQIPELKKLIRYFLEDIRRYKYNFRDMNKVMNECYQYYDESLCLTELFDDDYFWL